MYHAWGVDMRLLIKCLNYFWSLYLHLLLITLIVKYFIYIHLVDLATHLRGECKN